MKQAIETFVKKVNAGIQSDPYFADHPPGPDLTITVKFGRKYAKLLSNNGGAAWGFVDMTTGDLLKAASWSAPAKHARGNIASAEYGKNYVWTGPNYRYR